MRRQKPDDKDLFETSSTSTDNDSDEFIDFPDMPLLKCDEQEVKEGRGLQILTPNKLLTRLPILLAQIKVANNSYKLKNKIRKMCFLLYQNNKFPKKVYNSLIKLL